MADSVNDPKSVPGADIGEPVESAVLTKVTIRLIPFLFVLYVLNILDRANVGMAQRAMSEDLGLTDAAYGLGAGLFYVGYVLFEVPSNLILARVGARSWIARILITWGLVSSCMMFVTGQWSFYALRVALGIAEAGFFPGIILYLSHWFPARARAAAVAKFMIAGLIASTVGNPISGMILDATKDTGGLSNWQWLFLLEGIPSILMGFVTFWYLTDRPELATWLSDRERNWLSRRLEAERAQLGPREGHTLLSALSNPRVWLLIGVYFSVAMGDNAFGFFLPKLLRSSFEGASDLHIGLLAAIPSSAALVAMILVGMHSDRTGERRWHVACSAAVAAVGWLMLSAAPSPWLYVVALTVTVCGMKAMLPTFWAIPTSFLTGTAAAGGIALINSVANIGGFLAPTIMGWVKQQTGTFTAAMQLIAGVLCFGAVLVLFARREPAAEQPGRP
jgi:ACS family tartrate transporter-like MFS transporter